MRSLRVAARMSAFAFKGQKLDVRRIGDRRNVSWVVEGSVRRFGNRLRVTVASLFWRAIVHLSLGELDEAFDLLETAFERREGNLLYLAVVPRVPGFQDDPRFSGMLERMGLGHLLHDADDGR